jgi:hypothetical protein
VGSCYKLRQARQGPTASPITATTTTATCSALKIIGVKIEWLRERVKLWFWLFSNADAAAVYAFGLPL